MYFRNFSYFNNFNQKDCSLFCGVKMVLLSDSGSTHLDWMRFAIVKIPHQFIMSLLNPKLKNRRNSDVQLNLNYDVLFRYRFKKNSFNRLESLKLFGSNRSLCYRYIFTIGITKRLKSLYKIIKFP